jgi:hypothetical protein
MFDDIFLAIARVLGANVFKKYWFVDGSYWNRLNTNPKYKETNRDKEFFERIKRSAIVYTQQHANQIFFQIILVFVAINFVPDEHYNQFLWTNVAIFGIHIYALMIQRYNIILANRKIATFPLSPKSPDNDSVKDYDMDVLSIRKSGIENFYEIVWGYKQIGPYFETREAAKSYIEQLNKIYKKPYDIYLAQYYKTLPKPHFVKL